MDKHIDEAMAWSKKEQKVEVITLTPDQLAAWNAKLDSLSAKWVDDAKKAGLDGDTMLQDLKGIVKKNSAM